MAVPPWQDDLYLTRRELMKVIGGSLIAFVLGWFFIAALSLVPV